jgi:hypothetical protein
MRGENESEADRLRELRKQKRKAKDLRALGLSDEDISEEFSDDDDGNSGAAAGGNSTASAGGNVGAGTGGNSAASASGSASAGAAAAASSATTSGPTAAPQPPPKQPYMGNRSIAACNLANVRLAFKQEPALMNRFAYDEMLCTEMLMRPFDANPNFKPRPVTDPDIIKVQAWLQAFGFRKIGATAVRDAITEHAHNHSFHPVRDYLDRVAQAWDGKERVRTWLVVYAGAPLVVDENGNSTGYVAATNSLPSGARMRLSICAENG